MTLTQQKAQAKADYIAAKARYLTTGSKADWIAFCDAKIVCRRLGVII